MPESKSIKGETNIQSGKEKGQSVKGKTIDSMNIEDASEASLSGDTGKEEQLKNEIQGKPMSVKNEESSWNLESKMKSNNEV